MPRPNESRSMPPKLARAPLPDIRIRKAERGDVDALVALEERAFATDQLSRRSLERFIASPSAEVIVAQGKSDLAGIAIVLFRPHALAARLYSIAVAPHAGGRGIGPMLLDAAEKAALARGCTRMRLEVHHANHAAISRYRKSGYREFGRHRAYYEDGGAALRFEKRLIADAAALRDAPPYFHQTADFTCGPACIMMALAWAELAAESRTDASPSRPARKKFEPAPPFGFDLWRQATTIFPCSATGPGGCEPYGMAVTLARHGLAPEIH